MVVSQKKKKKFHNGNPLTWIGQCKSISSYSKIKTSGVLLWHYLSEVTPILHIHKNNSTTKDILCIEYNYRVNILWDKKCIYSINKNNYYWKEVVIWEENLMSRTCMPHYTKYNIILIKEAVSLKKEKINKKKRIRRRVKLTLDQVL